MIEKYSILLKLFVFTALLFLAPVLSFFASKNLFTSTILRRYLYYIYVLFLENAEIYSGVIAVIMVNLVILVYILLIFNDDEEMGTRTNKKKLKLKEEEDDDESKNSKDLGKKENSSARKRKV